MRKQFVEFLDHVESCDSCARVDLDLCITGEKLRASAWQGAADGIAAIVPVVPEQKGEPS